QVLIMNNKILSQENGPYVQEVYQEHQESIQIVGSPVDVPKKRSSSLSDQNDSFTPMYSKNRRSSLIVSNALPDQKCCDVCLSGNPLRHICPCSVLSHVKCELKSKSYESTLPNEMNMKHINEDETETNSSGYGSMYLESPTSPNNVPTTLLDQNNESNDVPITLLDQNNVSNDVPNALLDQNNTQQPNKFTEMDEADTSIFEYNSMNSELQKSSIEMPTLIPDHSTLQSLTNEPSAFMSSSNIQTTSAIPEQNSIQENNIYPEKDEAVSGIGKNNLNPESKTSFRNIPTAVVPPFNVSTELPDKNVSVTVLSSPNVPSTLLNQDEVDISIGKSKSKPPKSKKSSLAIPKASPKQIDTCVICLEIGHVVHICSCSVLTHKECALEYISFPGNNTENCPQCRQKLKYNILDQDTPMKDKYVIAFWFLLFLYLAMIGLSTYTMVLLIPSSSMNIYMYIALIANLGIMWPLLIVYLVTLGVANTFAPRDRTGDEDYCCRDMGCYWSGDCGGSGDCGCGGSGGGGDGCVIVLVVFCLILVFIILILASIYLVMSLATLYKSFVLKSKKEIVFKHEGRRLNTVATTPKRSHSTSYLDKMV
ncbi:unnamed protein product, partial [Meganyctiphanes norvegica]